MYLSTTFESENSEGMFYARLNNPTRAMLELRLGELEGGKAPKSADARPKLVLEFGGAYDKRRVEDFHADCAKRRLPYELW